jgi:glycosyltransferase involved in cell wall biosynthesis
MGLRGERATGGRAASSHARGEILYLCLQPLREGQASATHVRAIVDGLRKLGWHVRLVATTSSASRGLLARLIAAAWTQVEFVRHVRAADLAYVRWHPAAMPSVLAAKLARTPVILEVNGTFEDWFTAWPSVRSVARLLTWSCRSQLGIADGIVAVTEGLARWATRVSGNSTTAVIPNGAYPEAFVPSDASGADAYVAFVGALAPWQGVDVMLRAVRLPQWPSGVALTIAGDGALRDDCERANDGTSLRYVGVVPHERVPELLGGSIANLCVQTPTSGRGDVGCSPIKLYEGLASGRPVVASDLPGVGEVVNDARCGIVIPPGDARLLAEAVARLRTDERLAAEMGRRGREALIREHSWAARANATESFITEVLSP